MPRRPPHPDRLSFTARVARAALAHPEPLLRLLGQPEPIWRDGRRLHRSAQLLVTLAARTGRDDGPFEVAAMRRDLDRLASLASPVRQGVHAVDRRIPGPPGAPDIAVRVYRPHGAVAPAPAIVYAHGGGFAVGSLTSHDPTCRLLADVTGCVVVAVDYRLAPEHPFPAAVDDMVAAYTWVLEHPDDLGTTAGVVGVTGDSAGASLTAVLCLEARRLGLPSPTAQCLVYPLVDSNLRFGSYDTFAEGFSLTRRAIEWFRAQYTPNQADWDDPRVSPLAADDLSGLPPALVVTAGFDPLRDDGAAYADALRAAGVEVIYRCYDDMLHGFHGMLVLPDAAAAAIEIDTCFGDLVRSAAGLS